MYLKDSFPLIPIKSTAKRLVSLLQQYCTSMMCSARNPRRCNIWLFCWYNTSSSLLMNLSYYNIGQQNYVSQKRRNKIFGINIYIAMTWPALYVYIEIQSINCKMEEMMNTCLFCNHKYVLDIHMSFWYMQHYHTHGTEVTLITVQDEAPLLHPFSWIA